MRALPGLTESLLAQAWRLPLLVALTVVVPVLALGEASDAAARDRLAVAQAQDATDLARRGAAVAEAAVSELRRAVQRTASDPAVRSGLNLGDEKAASGALDALALTAKQITGVPVNSPDYAGIVLWFVDANGGPFGSPLGSSVTAATASGPRPNPLPGPDIAGRRSFLEARAAALAGSPRTTLALEHNAFASLPVISLVAPIQGGLRPFVGALVLEEPARWLGRALVPQAGAGQDLYVVTPSAALVTRTGDPVESGTDFAKAPPIGPAGLDIADPIAHARRIAASAPIGDTGWSVIGVVDPLAAEAALAGGLGTGRAIRIGLVAALLVGTVLLARSAAATARQRRRLAVLAIENTRLLDETRTKSAELQIANRHLAEANQHKSDFLANMSHELRTPLNAILGFSDVLRQRMFGELNERQSGYLDDINVSARHLLSLINDILDLSKVEAGKMELELSEFSLRETITSGMTMLRERAADHGIHLGVEFDPQVDLIVADERKIRQILFNLLSNAVKFTPDGGSVTVAASHSDSEVRVAVSDTGVGIAPEDQARIFEEFEQAPSGARASEGTGLGLALARRFVELHGGRIDVASEPGEGSTFTISLPLVAP